MNLSKKTIVLLMCLVFLFSVNTSAFACPTHEFKVLKDDGNIRQISTVCNNVEIYAELNTVAYQVSLSTVDSMKIEKKYKVNIETFLDGVLSGSLIDLETNEVHVIGQSDIVLPISDEAIKAVLTYLFIDEQYNRQIIVSDGIMYLDTPWVMAVLNRYDSKFYYCAIVHNGHTYIGPGLTTNEALERVKLGKDVFGQTQSYAMVIANLAGGGYTNPEIHGNIPFYFYHYHPKSGTNIMPAQCFYAANTPIR
ncbi:hypothetical protein GJ688_13785 [Heliobacillus mobilis]|uniref:Uncharacterized protein n=1 Tax=Heliobacterium mobile TaxID=28064 RepID=A0A6I3SNB7_HELMO|nr:hypothetical protein [Heliobacterium mobile]MTV50042.1 hypothetical protein [Heliobacterium mobile]